MNEDMSAANLLRAAARLVTKALVKLEMTEAPCPHCDTRLFKNRDHAKIFEQLGDAAGKMKRAALKLDEADVTGERSSKGYAEAAAAVKAKATR